MGCPKGSDSEGVPISYWWHQAQLEAQLTDEEMELALLQQDAPTLGERQEALLMASINLFLRYHLASAFREEGDGLLMGIAGFLDDLALPRLTAAQVKNLEKEPLVEKLQEELREMARCRAPGPDQLPVKYYQTYSALPLPCQLETLREVREHRTLPQTMREAQIIMVPKPGVSHMSGNMNCFYWATVGISDIAADTGSQDDRSLAFTEPLRAIPKLTCQWAHKRWNTAPPEPLSDGAWR
ncbi:hypothetical protein NDU88_000631 [Pleurodeles waltl]|uniref:Uncharacterized protein n=1 Tax=Pleurodeles waltl TaxID=8319 RepID=A0AAV7NGM7_PLEWA|nr:hypothetical protein NDU88_000631 [Pleurodeles waltl]